VFQKDDPEASTLNSLFPGNLGPSGWREPKESGRLRAAVEARAAGRLRVPPGAGRLRVPPGAAFRISLRTVSKLDLVFS
jgi:hypothetical protein